MSEFRPRWPWGNRHLQSIVPSLTARLRRRAGTLLASSRELILDCGDGVRLQAFHSSHGRPATHLAILLHGWEGSADAYYILSLGQRLFDAGVDVVRLNLRDHGATHHLNEGIFHSCRLPEVCGAVGAIGALFPGLPPWLIGYSLGGNFMLRVAASDDARVGPLAGVIAISPVLEPENTMLAMERGWQLYQRYFVRKWSRSLRLKRRLWGEQMVPGEILGLGDLRHMTAALVAQHTAFADIHEYLSGYAITGTRLATLKAPAVILTAGDDPIIPAADLGQLARPANLRIVTTARGGHIGFMVSPRHEPWINDFVLREMGL